MSLEKGLEKNKKLFIDKNLDSIKIINNEVVDIINGQGCLIKPETTILFGKDDDHEIVKIKDFDEPYSVISHGYMYCAEVSGELSNGDKFYIHARDPFQAKKILKSIINEVQKEFPEEEVGIDEIKIRSDFNRYKEDESIIESNKKDFVRKMESLGSDPEDVEVINESISGFTSEKVIGYNIEEYRQNFKNFI